MPRQILSSNESESTSDEDSEVEQENVRNKCHRYFQLGCSKEETFVELCKKKGREVDLDQSTEWFQCIDKNNEHNFGEKNISLMQSILKNFQSFRTQVSKWPNEFLEAFTLLNDRYAVGLRHISEKCQFYLLDNFYKRKRKLKSGDDQFVFNNNEAHSSQLYAIDNNHLLLIEIDEYLEYFDLYLLRVDLATRACKILANERTHGTSPDIIFDYTNRYNFLLRFYSDSRDSFRLGRIGDKSLQTRTTERINPDLIVIMRHYYKLGEDAKRAHAEINCAEGANTIGLNTVYKYYKQFEDDSDGLPSTSKETKTDNKNELKNLRLVLDEDNMEFSTNLVCPRLVGNKLQTFDSEVRGEKSMLTFGEYELRGRQYRPEFKKLFDLTEIDCNKLGSLRDEPFYWSNNVCYTCNRCYNYGQVKLLAIGLAEQELFTFNFYPNGYITQMMLQDGILNVCVDDNDGIQFLIYRIMLRNPDSLKNIAIYKIRSCPTP
ncbi:hypothetical protein M3Y97_00922100 [Aphelenchoides bicaudatus]|nr:hypothetical protein M3Y97_00922100 [Aphelenchoides bicaudatus]